MDVECKESMPSPEQMFIGIPFPYKKTYCGQELVFAPERAFSYLNPPLREQNAEDGAGSPSKDPEPGSPRLVLVSAEGDVGPSNESVDSSYVWVSSEVGSPKEPGVSYSSYSPTSPSEHEDGVLKSTKPVVGKTYYPIKTEETEEYEPTPPVSPDQRSQTDAKQGSPPYHPIPKDKSVSPRVGRTKGERVGGFKSPINGLPKLERFSPPVGKSRVREDSEQSEGDEEPVKISRTGSDKGPIQCARTGSDGA